MTSGRHPDELDLRAGSRRARTASTSPERRPAGRPAEPLATTSASSDWLQRHRRRERRGPTGAGERHPLVADVPLADRYKVYLWDGSKYNAVGTTTQTSWSTAGRTPLSRADSQIAGAADRLTGVIPTTARMAATCATTQRALPEDRRPPRTETPDYRFKVVPHRRSRRRPPTLRATPAPLCA